MQLDWNSLFSEVLKSNPGVATTFISVLLVPTAVLFLSNRHQKDLKRLEKELENKGDHEKTDRKQEDLAYGALIKILFGVQRLYTELSLPKCDPDCIDQSLSRFKENLLENQGKISDNQLYLEPVLIELIYKFYSFLADLEIELRSLSDCTKDIQVACVSSNATKLADVVVEFHEKLLLKRNPRAVAEVYKMPYFKGCCGGTVSPQDVEKYVAVMREIRANQSR